MYLITSTATCKYCVLAKQLLASKGLPFTENLLDSPEKLAAFKASGHTTVPQIWRETPPFRALAYIGGYDDLSAHLAKGEAA